MVYMVKKDLLKIIACLKCKSPALRSGDFLICNECKIAYPVLDKKIPDMIIDDIWPLEKAKKVSFKHNIIKD